MSVRRRSSISPLGRDASGAAAVEFGFIAPVLFLVLTGIVQYGIFFNDAQSARQAVRETLRQAVVNNVSNGDHPSCTGSVPAQMKCLAVNRSRPMAGDAYGRVIVPATWTRPNKVTLCVAVKSHGGFGLLPMPNSGWVRVRMDMSIEQDIASTPSSPPDDNISTHGQTWSGWCG